MIFLLGQALAVMGKTMIFHQNCFQPDLHMVDLKSNIVWSWQGPQAWSILQIDAFKCQKSVSLSMTHASMD